MSILLFLIGYLFIGFLFMVVMMTISLCKSPYLYDNHDKIDYLILLMGWPIVIFMETFEGIIFIIKSILFFQPLSPFNLAKFISTKIAKAYQLKVKNKQEALKKAKIFNEDEMIIINDYKGK